MFRRGKLKLTSFCRRVGRLLKSSGFTVASFMERNCSHKAVKLFRILKLRR